MWHPTRWIEKMKRYRVNEIFYSLQGEGCFTGTPAVFVRMSGCNRACPFCDTDFRAFTPMTAEDIVTEVEKYPCTHVVITGGEPTMQVDEELVGLLKEHGKYLQIETNGSLPVPEGIDWVTCSPKEPPYGIDRINELKIVYQAQDVEAIAAALPEPKVRCLQPCSGLNTAETVAYILAHPRWRLSLQTHKLIDIQ